MLSHQHPIWQATGDFKTETVAANGHKKADCDANVAAKNRRERQDWPTRSLTGQVKGTGSHTRDLLKALSPTLFFYMEDSKFSKLRFSTGPSAICAPSTFVSESEDSSVAKLAAGGGICGGGMAALPKL